MTHKTNCMLHCKEHLRSRNLSHVYNQPIFEHYYTKNNGAQGNAFLVGLNSADMMIKNFKPIPEETPEQNTYCHD